MSKPQKDIQCQNCGYPLRGDENYCPYCSQKNDVRPLSIKNYFQNIAGNFFNFDSKIWKTLIHLLKYPAKVPLAYIQGKRAGYSNPFRFLLQVSILYFLLAGVIDLVFQPESNFIKIDINKDKDKKSREDKVKQLVYQKLDSLDQQMHFTDLLNKTDLTPEQKDSIAQKVLKSKSLVALSPNRYLEFDHGNLEMETGIVSAYFAKYLKEKNLSYTYYPKLENKDEFEQLSVFNKIINMIALVETHPYNEMNVDEILKKLDIKNNLSNKLSIISSKRIISLIKNPETRDAYKRAVTSKVTMGLFFVLPLFGLFVFLLYYKQGYSYTETLVFIFYLQSVYFMVLMVELFLSLLPEGLSFISIMITELVFFVFLIKNFKAFYGQKTWVNALKVNLLVIPVYLILTGLSLAFISVISLVI